MNDPQLQPLAGQLGLRALPALVLFHQGRPDEQAILEGPQDEATLRHYFAAFAPKEEELLFEQGQQALAEGQADLAYAHLGKAHQLAPGATTSACGSFRRRSISICWTKHRSDWARSR